VITKATKNILIIKIAKSVSRLTFTIIYLLINYLIKTLTPVSFFLK